MKATVVDLRYKMNEVLKALENKMTLVSSNSKHFKPIKELKLKIFIP